MKLILSGVRGRMCQAIEALAKERSDRFHIVAGVDQFADSGKIVSDIQQITASADCIIDFSNPTALDSLLCYSTEKKIPLVLATTGYSEAQLERIKEASAQVPIFFTANMSLGVNLLAELCKKASIILGEAFDIEIVEKHHNQKLDAPSGTALLLADEMNSVQGDKYHYQYNREAKRGKRDPKEIGIHAVRGGTIVGEHDVIFAGEDEVVSLSHIAYSRNVFASGALKAAEFLMGKQAGLYSMKDIVKGI